MNYRISFFMSTTVLCLAVRAQINCVNADEPRNELTLTNGDHQEVFANDPTRRIGSFLFDTATGRAFRAGSSGIEDGSALHSSSEMPYASGERIGGTRVGRWLSLDPQSGKYPMLSPYAFVGNKPIMAIDPNGEEIWVVVGKTFFGRPKLVKYNPAQSDAERRKDMGRRYSGAVRNTFLMVDAIYAAHEQAGSTKMQELTADGTPVVELHPTPYQEAGAGEKGTSWFFDDGRMHGAAPDKVPSIAVFVDAAVELIGKDGEVKGAQSATVSLAHELGEAYFDLFKKDKTTREKLYKHEDFIIPEFEGPVVDYMQQKYQSGDTRQSGDDSDGKIQYQSDGPFTTAPKSTTP